MRELKFSAGITLYNPNMENITHINEYLLSFDYVFVFDNSDIRNEEYNKVISCLCNDERLIYIDAKSNKGLPIAYNSIIADKRCASTDFLCTLDQDSLFKQEDISAIIEYIKKEYQRIKDTVAIVAPHIDYGKIGSTHNESVQNVSWVITSGAFINLELIRKYSISYDEYYFVDRFDVDFCKQITKLGLIIQVYNSSVRHQKLGDENGHRHPDHSPIRHYYIARNRLYFNKKYYTFPKRQILNFIQSWKHLVLITLYESQKMRKINAFFKGYKDYNKGIYGKNEQFSL